MTPTPQAVLQRLRQAARLPGGFVLSIHAFSRAGNRSINRRDIANALLTAQDATLQDNGRWRVRGSDEDGDELTVIVWLPVSGPVEVITVY